MGALTRYFLCCVIYLTSVQTVEAAPDLLLAKELPAHVNVADYLISEKYDGVRGYWDGKKLWFRGGGEVHAPKWFTQSLPQQALDGEMWAGYGQFEQTASIVRQNTPDENDWRKIKYLIFELPNAHGDFAQRATKIAQYAAQTNQSHVVAVKQYRLQNRAELQRDLDQVVKKGGEGLMLHLASAPYATGRLDVLYKLKPLSDAEATVIGHVAGQGKYSNMTGALQMQADDGRVFRIGTGLSDELRKTPPPIGTVVTYKYRGLTKNGLPRFASYWRVKR